MRKKMRLTISVGYITLLILFFILLFTNNALAQLNQLNIHITDDNGYPIEEIDENEFFIVSVYVINDSEIIEWKIDVDIEFNDIHYKIDESAEIILQAPKVDSDRLYNLYASKNGYNPSNTTITILNQVTKKLVISTEDVVDGGNIFTVYVYDENGDPVSEVLVAIENIWELKVEKTDENGKAYLTAPETDDIITILAQKDGYISTDATIRINIPPTWWESLIESWYFPILIATILLIIAILFVNFRQKKSIYTKAKEITDNKTIEKYEEISLQKENPEEKQENQYFSKDAVRAQPDEDSKVEEIRISRPRKEKEIVPVDIDEDKTEKVINRKKIQNRDYDWFEGTDDIRYEIDKLTGEVDEEGLDKWYEGVGNLRDKIDEKVKKKDKKKNEDK